MTTSLLPFPRTAGPSLPTRLARRLVFERLAGLSRSRLVIEEPTGTRTFGPPEAPTFVVRVHDPEAWLRMALGGSLGAGEAYVEGLWDADDLVGVVCALAGEVAKMSALDGGRLTALRKPLDAVLHGLRRNSREGSRKNIARHYDLGNDFFRLWLDEATMMYSEARFEREGMTLEEAQLSRLERIGRQLELGPEDHLLEIGTGWGGLAVHAARTTGCRVTTATISKEQHALAVERVRAAGLEDRVEVLLRDYRDLEGRYDKVVSVEMIEAVGAEFLETYFAKVGELVRPEGLVLIQAITIPDAGYERAVKNVDFVKRYIFPGGQCPSLAAMSGAWSRTTDLRLLHLEDFGEGYAETLRCWRERFEARLPEVRAFGYDEAFIRLWRFYLAYCEGGFRERHCGVVQMLLAGPDARVRPRPA